MLFSRLVQPHEGANGDGFLYERHFRTVSLSPVASWSLIGVLLVGLLLGTIAVYAARCSRRRARQVVMPLRASPPRRWAFSEAAANTTATAAAAITTSTAAAAVTTSTAAVSTTTATTTGAAATATNEGARRCWCRNCANTVFLVEVPSPDACSLETVYSARSLLTSPVGFDPRRRPYGDDSSDSDLSSVSVQSIVFEPAPGSVAWQLPQVVVTTATPPIADSDAASTSSAPAPSSEANTLDVPDAFDRSLTYPPPPPLPRPLDK